MTSHLRLAYYRTRTRSLGQIESEMQEAKAALDNAPRGSYAEEYAQERYDRLRREYNNFLTRAH